MLMIIRALFLFLLPYPSSIMQNSGKKVEFYSYSLLRTTEQG